MKNKMMILLTMFLNVAVLHAMDEWGDFKKRDQYDNTELHFYSAGGNLDKVSVLLEQGFDVNATDKNKVTPLHWASFNSHLDIIKILVDKGADIHAQDENNLTPLAYALDLGSSIQDKRKQLDYIGFLISLGADINTRASSSGWTPLFYAIRANDIDLVRIFLEKGADVSTSDICDNTPLRYATLKSTPSIIRLLVKAGADVDARDGMGQTSLFDACRNGNYDNAQALIELGADVNKKGVPCTYNQMLTGIPCAWVEKPEVLVPSFCMSDGASMDRADHGLAPLHIASFNGHEEVVSLLIAHGANVNSASIKDGATPLHMAARQGHSSIVKKLLNAGAKTNGATMKSQTSTPKSLSLDTMYFIGGGITPLFSAIGTGKLDIVKIIAPITYVNKKAGFLNITPLHYACQLGHFDIVKELIRNKADHSLQLGNKFSAIEIALCHNHKEIAQFLNDLKEKSLPKTIKKEATVIRPSEMMTIIRNPHGDGYSESVIFKTCTEKNCLLPGEGGVYYHTLEGIKPVPANVRKQMVPNHLLNLDYAGCLKMGNVADIKHHFDPIVENTCGDWAWVVIDNNARKPDSIKSAKKKFDLYITLPGRIYNENSDGKIIGRHHKEELGAFEFKVRKTLYETKGKCYHRFYAPKGTVGATDFGAQARAKLLTSS